MADIKSLQVFGGGNKGLEKMKKLTASQVKEKGTTGTIPPNRTEYAPQKFESRNKKARVQDSISSTVKTRNGKVGAPIRKFDRVYAAKQPIKLSPLLNATSRILVEKYETDISRDELLRSALDQYIKQNFSQEDKLDLFNDVLRELDLFRNSKQEYRTVPEIDSNNMIIRSVEEIEYATQRDIIQKWGLKK